jgi:hypothetical protein
VIVKANGKRAKRQTQKDRHTMASTNPSHVSNLPSHGEMVARIIDTYNRALPSEIHAGERWYTEANEYAQALSAGTDLTMYQCAGIIAALSPQQAWSINKRNAARYVAARLECERLHTDAQMAKCAAIVSLSDGSYQNVARCLNGPKESAFYRNVAGDHSVPTVDRWAFVTATGARLSDKHGGISKSAYAPLARAWVDAARILGFPVAILQAICWIVERGSGE